MPDSREIERRIEEVLGEHEPVWAASIDMLVRCDCGHGHDIAGYDRDGHNAHVAGAVVQALGLTEEWSDDVAGPEWARYSRWVTPSVTHHGTAYTASTERAVPDPHAGQLWANELERRTRQVAPGEWS